MPGTDSEASSSASRSSHPRRYDARDVADDCIFCSIIAGEAPAVFVYEDEHAVGFMDINPWTRGHAVVVPRRHSENLYEIDDADLRHTMLAAKRLAAQLTRYDEDSLTLPHPSKADPGQLEAVAAELRG